ncbi:hypothetical protein TRVL_05607 [Trypanosoma vivax]|nr:hypothetical protein TRVL_05607 [Trypanosoma vivax]
MEVRWEEMHKDTKRSVRLTAPMFTSPELLTNSALRRCSHATWAHGGATELTSERTAGIDCDTSCAWLWCSGGGWSLRAVCEILLLGLYRQGACYFAWLL